MCHFLWQVLNTWDILTRPEHIWKQTCAWLAKDINYIQRKELKILGTNLSLLRYTCTGGINPFGEKIVNATPNLSLNMHHISFTFTNEILRSESCYFEVKKLKTFKSLLFFHHIFTCSCFFQLILPVMIYVQDKKISVSFITLSRF